MAIVTRYSRCRWWSRLPAGAGAATVKEEPPSELRIQQCCSLQAQASAASRSNWSFCCTECGHKFSSSSHLLRHLNRHISERNSECEVCLKKFSRSSNLIAHMRVHTGDRPYKCKECHKKFSQLASLIAHKRVHTGEKPYNCKECHKKFSQPANLIAHKRVHTL